MLAAFTLQFFEDLLATRQPGQVCLVHGPLPAKRFRRAVDQLCKGCQRKAEVRKKRARQAQLRFHKRNPGYGRIFRPGQQNKDLLAT